MSELAHVPLLLPREDFNFGEREKPQMLRISQAIDIFPPRKEAKPAGYFNWCEVWHINR